MKQFKSFIFLMNWIIYIINYIIGQLQMKNQNIFTTIKLTRVKSDRDFGSKYINDLEKNNNDQIYTQKSKAKNQFKQSQNQFCNEKKIIQTYYLQSMRQYFIKSNQNSQSIPDSAHPDSLIKSMTQNILKRQRIQEANKNLRYQLQSKDQKIKELISKQISRSSIRNSVNSFDRNSLLEIEPGDRNSIKGIKTDEFIFRIKLKLISTLQQLEIKNQVIQQIRNLQIDTQILQVFVNAVKEKFNTLKISSDQLLQLSSKSTNSIGALQKIQFISMQNQAIQYQQNEKRLKAKINKINNEYNDTSHKLRLKQSQIHDFQTEIYRLNANVRQNQKLIQKLQNQVKSKQTLIKSIEKKYKQEKESINQSLNRQIQQKSSYLTKWQQTQYESLQYQTKLKRYQQTQLKLQREIIKWKERSQWHQKQEEAKEKQIKKNFSEYQSKLSILTEENANLKNQRDKIYKQFQKQKSTSNKNIQKIIQEWKEKLISNVQEYQLMLQDKQKQSIKQEQQIKIRQSKIKQLEAQNILLCEKQKDQEKKVLKSQYALRNMEITLKQVTQKVSIQTQQALQAQKQKKENDLIGQNKKQIQILKRQKQELQRIVIQLKIGKAQFQGYQDKINSMTVNFKIKETSLTNQIQKLKQQIEDLRFRIKKTAQLQGQYLNKIRGLQEEVKSSKSISKQSVKNQNKEEQIMPQNVKRMYYRVQANSPQYSRYSQRFLTQKSPQNSNKQSRQTNYSKTNEQSSQK